MALGAVEIVYYEDCVRSSKKSDVIYGHPVGYKSGANGSSDTIPGNATHLTIYTAVDTYIRIQTETTTPAAGAGVCVPAKTLMTFELLPLTNGTLKVYYAAA